MAVWICFVFFLKDLPRNESNYPWSYTVDGNSNGKCGDARYWSGERVGQIQHFLLCWAVIEGLVRRYRQKRIIRPRICGWLQAKLRIYPFLYENVNQRWPPCLETAEKQHLEEACEEKNSIPKFRRERHGGRLRPLLLARRVLTRAEEKDACLTAEFKTGSVIWSNQSETGPFDLMKDSLDCKARILAAGYPLGGSV